MLTAMVEAYKRFEIHDGPGVRTTVFLKGCPLNCRWCHNPECIDIKRALAYHANQCVLCGECAKVCPTGAHEIINGEHLLNRKKCLLCGKCADACAFDALRIHGKIQSVNEVVCALMEDRIFFGNDGGVTISGGEPLMHSKFVALVFQQLRAEGIHTALDTCLYAERKALEDVLPHTELFLADLKAMDEAVHIRATGRSNRIILENFRFLSDSGAQMEIRIPFVPGYNDDQMEQMADFICRLKGVTGVKVLPYHDYAENKYTVIGKAQEKIRVPEKKEIDEAKLVLNKKGIKVLE